MFKNKKAFTLIEILMVIVLIGVLGAVGVSQFVDFRSEARDAATRAALSQLRAGIKAQFGQMQINCAATGFPPLANLTANDITDSNSPCTAGTVDETAFVQGGIPNNPWTDSNTITACTAGNGCTDHSTDCDDDGTWEGGWCYNADTGEIWANSNSNDTTDEYSF